MSEKERIVFVADVGTQSTRALLVNNRGDILAKEAVVHDPPYFSADTDLAEQDADFYYEKLCSVSKALKAKAPEEFGRIEAASLTTIRDTTVCVDSDGRPLRPAILWLDNRKTVGKPEFSRLIRLTLKAAGMEETANMQYRKGKCNWIRENEPEIWAKTYRYLLLGGYLVFKLTGNFRDSSASIVGRVPYDVKTRNWQKKGDLTRPVFPVEKEKLCELVEPGEVFGRITARAADDSGLPEGLPLIASGSDKACEILGLGCTTPEKAAISLGTTATITCNIDRYVEPERFIPPYASILPGHFSPEIEIYRGYWLVSWFKKEFAHKEVEQAKKEGVSAETLLNRRLHEIPAGCGGLIFQPYFTPNTTMPAAKGAIIGFSDIHTRIHVYRAIIEGINFALMGGLRQLEKQSGSKFRSVYAGGGGASSDEICQITANMFGLDVRRTQTFEVAGIGCAMAAFVGLGEFSDYNEAAARMVRDKDSFAPDMEQHSIYVRLYEEIFSRVYEKLLPLYEKTSDIL